METQVLQDPQLNLDLRIDAFEEARRINPRVDLASFLPPRDHPRYLSSLAELIRVELDQDWAGGHGKPLATYCLRFPELSNDSKLMQEVAFEEYRLRRQAGDAVTPEEYRTRFNVDASAWPLLPAANQAAVATTHLPNKRRANENDNPLDEAGHGDDRISENSSQSDPSAEGVDAMADFRELERERPGSARRVTDALASLPKVGQRFLGFRLIDELGRGAFGRVFLAQQLDLANRLVALKVATDIFDESQTLAQLQHTNIVPIYSFHQVGKLQAVCMPYCGATTLSDVLQHIESLGGRPLSGKDLVSTLNSRRSITRTGGSRPLSIPAAKDSVTAPNAVAPTELPPSNVKLASDSWKTLEGMSFTDAALWLAVRIVDGLAYAHEHGVLHRDLKPANILITDDGTPMLLDFNLAINSEVRANPAGARMGGTLPYMAPEHMLAFRGAKYVPDERSDIWSIGVIMFNLLTGRHPHPSYSGKINDIIAPMLDDRSKPPPSLRTWNADVSPSLEAIVRRCLDPNPDRRYPSARALHEDLKRQLEHQPLKYTREPSRKERFAKWRKRHPRLTSSSAIAIIAAAAILGASAAVFAARERVRTLHARTEFTAHRDEFQSIQAMLYERSPTNAQLDEGLKRCAQELDRYGVAGGLTQEAEQKPDIRRLDKVEQLHLRQDIGELFFLMAKAAVQKAERAADPSERDTQLCSAERWNALAETSSDRLPRAIREQRADLFKLKGLRDAERELRESLRSTPPKTPRDHCLLGQWLVKKGRYRDALPHLTHATQDEPENFSAWMVRGNAQLALDQPEMAVASFSAAIALRPEYAPAWLNRALAYSKLHFGDLALDDLNRAIILDGSQSEAYIQRAFAKQALDKWDESVDDLTAALDCQNCSTRAWFLRSFARRQSGDWLGSLTDWAMGLKEPPNDDLSFVARAENRLNDPPAALADVESALRLNPLSPDALQLKAHILSERMHKADESLAVLDKTIELYPDSAIARAGRGVVLARQGKRTEAIRDAEESLRRDSKAPNLYMIACIYALTSRTDPGDRLPALEYLSSALRRGYGLDIVDEDSDLDPIRGLSEFKRIVGAAKELATIRRAENPAAH